MIDANMTIKEVADRMKRSEQWVRVGLQQKRLPFRNCCRKYRKTYMELSYITSWILAVSIWICSRRIKGGDLND